MTDMQQALRTASDLIRNSDALLLGASNGLSIAEGYNIFADNEMFKSQFGAFRDKYLIRNVLDGCFHRYADESVRTAFLETLVHHWVRSYTPSQVMLDLLAVVGDKDHFVITSNADTHLELAGFAPERVFEIEGTFELWLKGQEVDDKSAALNAFLDMYRDANLVFLELGIGSRNQLIKAPMMRLCASLPQTSYIILNLPQEIAYPDAIASRTLALPGDLAITLRELAHAGA